MTTLLRMKRTPLLLSVVVLLLLTVTEVEAQEDSWSLSLTPEIWAAHIAKSGLPTPSGLGGLRYSPLAGQVLFNQFRSENSSPVDSIDPQWGLQVVAGKGRWTLSGSFQYVTFETRSDLVWRGADRNPLCLDGILLQRRRDCVNYGDRVAQEFVNTTRVHLDGAVSYAFPDIVPGRLDLSLGGGFKVIYASASRQYGRLGPVAADIVGPTPTSTFPRSGLLGNGLYAICSKDDCSDLGFRDRVKTTSWLYGGTFPVGATFHLTTDDKWTLPVRVTPFVGVERRNDHNVVYQVDRNTYPTATLARDFRVKRLDGTTVAYGATVDATLRLRVNDTLSAYAGGRVEYIEGHEKYLAYGPVFGASVRFSDDDPLRILAEVPLGTAAGERWSFTLTPQFWAAHIAKNGFVAPSGLGDFGHSFAGQVLYNQFRVQNSKPVDSVNPQWGLQLAAQKGRWTLAGSFQYVTFETRSDVMWNGPDLLRYGGTVGVNVGDRVAQEFVNTTRIDTDLAVGHFFPDVVSKRLDLSLGGGFKVIYATASRQYSNLSPFATFDLAVFSPGLYAHCVRDNCSDFAGRDRAKTTSWLYGPTFPMSANLHLTNDTRWVLPIKVTPFIGAESRDDRDIVYQVAQNAYPSATVSRDFRVKRLDGTTLAYGVTVDANVHWLLNNAFSVYAGGRVQFIQGHEKYLAYGPLFGMSVRFGGN